MRVTYESDVYDTPRRCGTVTGYVQVTSNVLMNHAYGEPNIWAIVVDDATGTFCAMPIWKLKARRET